MCDCVRTLALAWPLDCAVAACCCAQLHSGHGRAKAIAAPGGGGGGGSGTGSGSGGAADIGLALSQRSSASRGDKDAKIRSSLGVSPGPSGRSRGVGLGLGLGGQGGGAGGDGLGSQAEWAAQHKSLAERLRMTVDDLKDFDPLPAQLLRKYIAYAKKYVKPKYPCVLLVPLLVLPSLSPVVCCCAGLVSAPRRCWNPSISAFARSVRHSCAVC